MEDRTRGRFVFIDALRGLAAVAVVFHHACFESQLSGPLDRAFPALLRHTFFNGDRGVQVFFIISGFVIAHSLRRTIMSPRECGRFILRRQLRLDPPYWVMLILASLFAFAFRSVPAMLPRPFPGWPTLGINLLYLERILGRVDILQVGWTLAIEIQFYLAFMLILATSRKPGPSGRVVALLLLSAIASVFTDPNVTYEARWAVNAWPYFVSGAFCYWAVQRQCSPWYMAAVLAAMAASSVAFGVHSQVIVGVMTTVAIYVAGQTGRLYTLGGNRLLQFLGRISYSLYLTHMLVVVSFLQGAYLLTRDNRAAAVGWYVLSILVAVVVAYCFHVLIELPSMRWATRFKRDPGPSAATGFGEELPPIEDAATVSSI